METTDKRIEEKIKQLNRKYELTAVSFEFIVREAIEYGESLSRDRAVKEI